MRLLSLPLSSSHFFSHHRSSYSYFGRIASHCPTRTFTMTRSRPSPHSRRSTERRAAAGQGDAAENNDNNERNEDAAPEPDFAPSAAVAGDGGQGRRSLRSTRHSAGAANNDDASEEPSSGSKRKRKLNASNSSTGQQARISRARPLGSRLAAALAAAPPAPEESLSTIKLPTKQKIGTRKRKSRSNSQDHDNNNQGNNDILEAFCGMLAQGAPEDFPGEPARRPPPIDMQKAANVLEAAAGNLALAVNLYWDDFFASANHHHDQNDPPAAAAAAAAALQEDAHQKKAASKKPKARKKKSKVYNPYAGRKSLQDSDESEDHDDNEEEEDRKPSARSGRHSREERRAEESSRSRRLRRSLDPDFQAADPEEEDNAEGQDAFEDGMANAEDAAPESAGEEEADDGNNQAPDPDGAVVMNVANNPNGDGSISVSDDEAPGRFARVRFGSTIRSNAGRQAHPLVVERRIREAAAAISKKVLNHEESPDAPRQRDRDNANDDDLSLNENPDDYISDSDWLETQKNSALGLLWGNNGALALSTGGGNNSGGTNRAPAGNGNNNNDAPGLANAIDLEEDENESVDAGEMETEGEGIPYTWLNDGFHLSDCGTGLVVKIPKAEDIEILAWRQRNMGARRNALPPPIHCMGTTSILSIVTALFYTGASIQGNTVNCTSAKKPWSQLSLDEKKLEFEDRLTDALSSLIFIAADASRKRKQKALRLFRKHVDAADNPSVEDMNKLKKMTARLNLIPTCIWDEDLTSTLPPRQPDGPASRRIPIKISWTNIQDIRLYVLSTIRSFTTKGGIALLLETLIRIHGPQVINRQMKKGHRYQIQEIQQSAGPSGDAQQSVPTTFSSYALVRCTCEERQKQLLGGKPVPANILNDPSKLIEKLTPPGTECVFDGLLCLIVCGEVTQRWNDCVPKGLGIGLLTSSSEMSWALSRPERPVWVVKGPTCYSMLFMEEGKDFDVKTAAKIDKAQSSINLCHWNPWYVQTQKSKLRIISGRPSQPPSKLQQQLVHVEDELKTKLKNPDRMFAERTRRKLIDAVSAEQHQQVQENMLEDVVQKAEMDRVRINPEDIKLYPDQRQMWRFDMGDDGNQALDKKPRAEKWTSYHRLTNREKRIIELKLGPKINHILWTRWPATTIDNFTNDPVV
jgi:hypothetical protein